MALRRARTSMDRALSAVGPQTAPPATGKPTYSATGLPAVLICGGCGEQVSRSAALRCVNHCWSWHDFPACASAFHPGCYRIRRSRWPTVLPPSSHKQLGLAARLADARIHEFICELCRVRAQTGSEVTAESRPLMELERVRILTRWTHHSDTTATGAASARLALQRLDVDLPKGCPTAVLQRFPPRWPRPRR